MELINTSHDHPEDKIFENFPPNQETSLRLKMVMDYLDANGQTLPDGLLPMKSEDYRKTNFIDPLLNLKYNNMKFILYFVVRFIYKVLLICKGNSIVFLNFFYVKFL